MSGMKVIYELMKAMVKWGFDYIGADAQLAPSFFVYGEVINFKSWKQVRDYLDRMKPFEDRQEAEMEIEEDGAVFA